jgi:hypothetical protein
VSASPCSSSSPRCSCSRDCGSGDPASEWSGNSPAGCAEAARVLLRRPVLAFVWWSRFQTRGVRGRWLRSGDAKRRSRA